MRIFVTGGTGFIGRHVVERLKDHELMLLARKRPEGLAGKVILGELSDIGSWKEKVKRFNPDVCLHLAWEGIPDYGPEMSKKNLDYGISLMNMLAEIGCKKIIATGSCWEYGRDKGVLKEGDSTSPKNDFTDAKNKLNSYGMKLAGKKGIVFVWLRLFYVYGPGQREGSLIPSMINSIRQGRKPDIRTPGNKNDFVYAADVAEAIAMVAEKAEKSAVYNIGSGKSTSVKEVVDIIAGHLNADIKMGSEGNADFWADISKIKDAIGWKPKTDIKKGIRETISFLEGNMRCTMCSSESTENIYKQDKIPVHNNIVYDTPEESRSCNKGAIILSLCSGCGLVFNSELKKDLLEYEDEYDNNRSFSAYYNEYISNLVKTLVNKHGVKGKRILEIGCGDGSFLLSLCRESGSKGTGFDPTYRGEGQIGDVSLKRDYFGSKYAKLKADVLILRHVLEHIEKPSEFIAGILKSINLEKELVMMIEVPDLRWILKQGAFWDITYEHCNYFTKESLANLLGMAGVDIESIFNTFSGQYIVAIGRYKPSQGKAHCSIEDRYLDEIRKLVGNMNEKKESIRSVIRGIKGQFSIWGAAGKGVTFINMLDGKDEKRVPFLIDINRNKQGKYCPGTDKKIAPPSILDTEKGIKDIFIMNPNYFDEIEQQCMGFGRRFNLIKV